MDRKGNKYEGIEEIKGRTYISFKNRIPLIPLLSGNNQKRI
jgi:hypothetical protein